MDSLAGAKSQAALLGNLLSRAGGAGRAAWLDLPDSPGVYAVCLPGWEGHEFTGDPGWAPNVEPADVRQLRNKRERILAAGSTDILYIGKAGGEQSTLRKRIRALARFGMGRRSRHKGGAPLWQLDGIEEAQAHMWCCQRGRPESLERELLDRFRAERGDWPLANRVGGSRSR